MKVTLLGTGTSTGVPVVACECAVCRSADPRDSRTRVSALLSWDGKNIVIDTGPDFRHQMLRHAVTHLDAILYTHGHADHLNGLDDIRGFCFRANGPMPLYGDKATLDRVSIVFDYAFRQHPEGGSVPRIELREIDGSFDLFGCRVVPLRVWHGSTPVLAYRIGQFAYATDCNRIPAETLEQLAGVDVLVLDALRERPHSTHFSIGEAIGVAQAAGAKQTYFVHMTHDVSHEETDAALPDGIELAYDGLSFEVA